VSPYRDLYVYMVGGVVPESEEGKLGDAFLGNWVEDTSSFLFFSTPSEGEVSGLLQRRPELQLQEDYHFTYEEWQGGGLDPVRIDPFVITAPWQAADAVEGEIRIRMDPGVVFGTGLHPTTRDCLSALVYLRGLASMRIRVVQGSAEDWFHEEADLVMANIHHEVLKGLIASGRCRRNGLVLLSGLMRSQAAEVRQEMSRQGIRLVREWEHEMTWYTMLWGSYEAL
jgi:ribosomal protein L11 methyltransferase